MGNRPGQFADYQIRQPLHQHGGYQSFLAEEMRSGKNVLLKVPHERFRHDAIFMERFVTAGKRAAGLRHKHIEQVFEVSGKDAAAPTGFIVAEYLSSISLAELLRLLLHGLPDAHVWLLVSGYRLLVSGV